MIQLRTLKVEGFEDSTAAALATAIQTFLDAAGEATLVSVHYAQSGAVYSALIVYTT